MRRGSTEASTVVMDAAERPQTRSEEMANAISHGAGVLLALAAAPWLIDAAQRQSGALGRTAVIVFIATMALQYGVSAVYHALPAGRAKRWAMSVDHATIYLFIAGSAMPFTLGSIGGTDVETGALSSALVWGVALAGAWLKLRRRLMDLKLSTALYVVFGCAVAALAWPTLRELDITSLSWLFGGGAAYLVGAGFFLFDHSLRFGHFIWHLFALAGSGCHVCAALWPALV
jgi:hemolysin III